jgi:hypothetical protein
MFPATTDSSTEPNPVYTSALFLPQVCKIPSNTYVTYTDKGDVRGATTLAHDLLPERWRRRNPAVEAVGRLDKAGSR